SNSGHVRVFDIQSLCTEGCTDEIAINYNELASTDDGSCILSTQFNGYNIFLQPYPNYEPLPWSPYNSSNLDVFEDNYGGANGKQNTQDIVDFYGMDDSYAANYCYNLEQHGYSDWYLPSTDELGAFHSYLSSEWDLMDYYSNTEVTSGEQTIGCCFSQPLTSPGIFYWTSNENYPSESATLKKIFENAEWHDNKSNTHPVRCVRNNAVEGCQDEAACNYKMPWDVDVKIINKVLNTPAQYEGMMFTHYTDNMNAGILCSAYKTLPSMQEKLTGQMEIAEKVRAVDEVDVARLVIDKHFIRDIKGNLRKFSQQEFRCVKCNTKYRRPPLRGVCTNCGGKIVFTISEGSIVKYLEPSISLSTKYDLPVYVKQTLELTKRRIEGVFGKEKEKQLGLGAWFG
ncbi:hypothetical protein HN814_12085, partial [Candidatus Woesearchaeota archaeon]|nr:hypothetical protein [Candidatus Woesearchaeota archaeon]